MADPKKPESPGPVVIRKGVVEPLPPAEPAEAKPAAGAPEMKDTRPLWQRLADEKRGAAPGGPGGARPQGTHGKPRDPRGPGGRGPGGRPRGERRPDREARGAREERPAPGPQLPPGEPPPAPRPDPRLLG